jgi:cardiolipin synthase
MRLPWRRRATSPPPASPSASASDRDGGVAVAARDDAAPGGAAPTAVDEAPAWRRRLVLAFALLGVVAAVLGVLSLFSALGRRPEAVHATARPPVSSAEFVTAVAGSVNAPVQSGGTAQLLRNGREILPVLLADLRAARRSIHFMVYIWEPGAMSDSVTAVLEERARAGVEVRVLLDGFGSSAPDSAFARLADAGVRIATFRPVALGTLTRLHRRNHRRSVVIDGVVAHTGGWAVGDKWLGDAKRPEEWRDDGVRVTGRPARSLQAAFAQLWTGTAGEVLAGDAYFPPEPETAPPADSAARAAVAITRHVSVASSPAGETHPLRTVFWMTFASARERLWITTPYFVPDGHVRAVLAERARAGVDVRLLLPSEHTDAAPVRWAAQRHYEELLRAGVRIYEYQPSMLHAKSVVVDGTWSVVGSANLDIRSHELNEENVLGLQDRDFAAQLERAFLADAAASREVRLAEWQGRGWWARTREWAASIVEEQM